MGQQTGPEPTIIVAEVVPEPQRQVPPAYVAPRRRVWAPLLLFAATCLSVLLVGGVDYAWPLMTILVCHEAGHFIQARRYGVFASYPYFIPMPLGIIGTFGAVILMDPRMPHRKAVFDIGISGPLAGLAPTIVFCILGLQASAPVPAQPGRGIPIGEPLLFELLTAWILPPLEAGHTLALSPMAYAGWVGLLITSLNLFPIGQLDGGHILYALLRGRAAQVATLLLLGAAAAVVLAGLWGWALMLFLLMAMGPAHPPTANDAEPLGLARQILGWLTLGFIALGFTPNPFPRTF